MKQEAEAALRADILEAASRLLVEEGPAALTMRRLADAVDVSTSVLYTRFGGKDGIVATLCLDGFTMLGEHMASAARQLPEDAGPLTLMATHARGYRAFAHAAPHRFAVMFGQAMPEFLPDAEVLATSTTSLGVLVRTVVVAQSEGLVPPGRPDVVALKLWSGIHGFVVLEAGGHFELASESARQLMFDELVQTVIEGVRRTPVSPVEGPVFHIQEDAEAWLAAMLSGEEVGA